eukprot:SAG22_NODE_1530_length_4216_cov_5.617926_4_plen_343_part_00
MTEITIFSLSHPKKGRGRKGRARKARAKGVRGRRMSATQRAALSRWLTELAAPGGPGLEAAFAELDLNGDGRLSTHELHTLVKRGVLDPTAMLAMVAMADTNKDGNISLVEFYRLADALADVDKLKAELSIGPRAPAMPRPPTSFGAVASQPWEQRRGRAAAAADKQRAVVRDEFSSSFGEVPVQLLHALSAMRGRPLIAAGSRLSRHLSVLPPHTRRFILATNKMHLAETGTPLTIDRVVRGLSAPDGAKMLDRVWCVSALVELEQRFGSPDPSSMTKSMDSINQVGGRSSPTPMEIATPPSVAKTAAAAAHPTAAVGRYYDEADYDGGGNLFNQQYSTYD